MVAFSCERLEAWLGLLREAGPALGLAVMPGPSVVRREAIVAGLGLLLVAVGA